MSDAPVPENAGEDQERTPRTAIPLPNSTTVLVLGIVSIPACCCYGIVGVGTSIAALLLARQDLRLYRDDPDRYTRASYQNLDAGRICAIIGLILSVISMIGGIASLFMSPDLFFYSREFEGALS